MAHRIVFVCEANVCRSPLMSETFRRGLRSPDDWIVSDKGIAVPHRDLAACKVAAALLGNAESLEGHLSSQLTKAAAGAAALIIVASLNERSWVANLDPALRTRTFTLREAIALGSQPETEVEWAAASVRPGRPRTLAGYAAILHARRGTVQLPTGRRLFRSAGESPLDIPDAHHLRPNRHRSVLKGLVAETDRFRIQVEEALSAG